MKRDLFAALIGVHYSLRQLQLTVDDIRSLQLAHRVSVEAEHREELHELLDGCLVVARCDNCKRIRNALQL